jgi:hypothetical protein
MSLVQVVEDTTMLVSGYERHTWQCSVCSTVEQRITFTRRKTPTPTVQVQPTQTELAEPTQGVPAEPSEAMLVDHPTEAMPVKLTEAAPVEPTQTKPVEPIQTRVAETSKTEFVEPTKAEPTDPELPAAMVKANARAKALDEKVRNLKERATAAREAVGKIARPTQFNRDRDNKSGSVPPPSASSSEASSHVKPDEPLRSPTEPVATTAPTSHDDPVAPRSNAPAAPKLRERLGELMRTMRRREFSKVR